MTVGTRIIEAREAKGWKRPRLAEEAGVPYPTLAGLENGDQQTSAWIPAIAAATGVNALWLASGKGAMQASSADTHPSHSGRLPFDKIGDAVTVLREYLAIVGDPSEWISDPVLLEITYELIEEYGHAVTPTNVIDLTKRLGNRIRTGGSSEQRKAAGVSRTLGTTDRRAAQKTRKTSP